MPLKKTDGPVVSERYKAKSAPLRVVSRDVQLRANTVSVSHVYNYGFTETAEFSRTNNHRVALMPLPELLDDGSNLSRMKTHLQDLRFLLDKARDKERCKELTKTDAQRLVEFCQGKRWAFVSTELERLKKAIRIFSYIAGHGFRLPDHAVETIINQLEEASDYKVIKYGLLALSHALHNKQSINFTVEDRLKRCLIKKLVVLTQQNQQDNLYVITVVLSALSQHGQSLSKTDLNILKLVLKDVEPTQDHPLYQVSPLQVQMKPDNKSVWAWTQEGQLKLIKKESKAGNLSSKELNWMIQQWGNGIHLNTKISHIIKHAVMKGKRGIILREEVVRILKESLKSNEKKIRQNAIITLNYFRRNSQPFDVSLDRDLTETLIYQRRYALEAVIAYLNQAQASQVESSSAEWIAIFEKLQYTESSDVAVQREASQVRHYSKYALYLIKHEIDHLKEQLLDPEFCVEASMALLKEAKDPKTKFNDAIVTQLATLACDAKFSLIARINAIDALGYVAEKGQEFPKKVVESIVQLLASSDTNILNSILVLLGHCSTSNLQHVVLLQAISGRHLFERLGNFLNDAGLAYNTSFLFATLMKKLTNISYPVKLSQLISVATDCLSKPDCSNDVKKNICSGLYNIAHHHAECFREYNIMAKLAASVSGLTDQAVRRRAISVLGLVLESVDSVELPSPAIIDSIIALLKDETVSVRDNATYVLMNYIKKANVSQRLSIQSIHGIFQLLEYDNLTLLVSHVLLVLAEKQYLFSDNEYEKLAGLLKEGYPEVRMTVSNILRHIPSRNFSRNVMEVLEQSLQDNEPEVVDNIIFIFKTIFQSQVRLEAIPLTHVAELIHNVVDIVINVGLNVQARLDAVSVLSDFSKLGGKIDLDDLLKIKDLLNSENEAIKIAVMDLFYYQISFHQVSIKNNNEAIVAILESIEQSLDDELALTSVLNILKLAVSCGYLLSKNASVMLAKIILYNKNKNIRIQVFLLLYVNFKNDIYPQEVKQLVLLEGSILRLGQVKQDSSEQLLVLQIIQKAILAGQSCTLSGFDEFKSIFDSCTPAISNVVEICLIILKNGQDIPAYLSESFCNYIKFFLSPEKSVFTIKPDCFLFLAKLAEKGMHLPTDIYKICEKILLSDSVDYQLLSILNILEIGIKRGFVPTEDCSKKIMDLLLIDDSEVQQSVINIMSNLAVIQFDINYFLDKLMTASERTKNDEIRTQLIAVINIVLSQQPDNCLSNPARLADMLITMDDPAVETKLFAMLEHVKSAHPAYKKVTAAIRIKKAEYLFNNSNVTIEEKIKALKFLMEGHYCFSLKSLKNLGQLLGGLGALADQLQTVLQCIENINISAHVVIIPESDIFFAQLMDFFIDHPSHVVRTAAFNILKNTKDHLDRQSALSEKLTRLLFVEVQCSREILKEVQHGLPLTRSNILVLLNAMLFDDQALQADIATILCEEKHRISLKIYEIFFSNLLTRLNQSNFFQLCGQAIVLINYLTNHYDSERFQKNYKTIVNKLLKNLPLDRFCLSYFNLVKSLCHKLSGYSQELLPEFLVKAFFDAPNIQSQRVILEYLSSFILSRDNFSEKMLQDIRSLLPVLLDNHGKYHDNIKQIVSSLFSYVYRLNEAIFQSEDVENIQQQFGGLETSCADSNAVGFVLSSFACGYSFVLSENTQQSDIFYNTLLLEAEKQDDIEDDHARFDQLLGVFKQFFCSSDHADSESQHEHSLAHFLHALFIKQKLEKMTLSNLCDYLHFFLLSSETEPDKHWFNSAIFDLSSEELKNLWITSKLRACDNGEHIDQSDITMVCSLYHAMGLDIETAIRLFELAKTSGAQAIINFFKKMKKSDVSVEVLRKCFLQNEHIKSMNDLERFVLEFGVEQKIDDVVEQFLYQFGSVSQRDSVSVQYKHKKFVMFIKQLDAQGWSCSILLEKIHFILEQMNSTTGFYSVLMMFRDIVTYHVPEDKFYEICTHASQDEVMMAVRQFIVKEHYSHSGKEKPLNKLLEELTLPDSSNQDNPSIISFFEEKNIELIFKRIDEQRRQTATLLSGWVINNENSIDLWTVADIKAWAKHIKSQPFRAEFLSEILAVISRACYLHEDYYPRDVQILTLLSLLNRQPNLGRFAQVITGEGKSTILAMLATIKTLSGEVVDIITSSPLLAKRDAQHYQQFYDCFNLKVASNEDKGYSDNVKPCYKEDVHIVYGDANNFEFDLLRHEYSGLTTRGKRPYQAVIIDEVDNLLIDENSKIAMLANTMPGMKSLLPIFLGLWHELQNLIYCFNVKQEMAEGDLLDGSNYQTFGLEAELAQYLEKIAGDDNKGDLEKITVPAHLKKFVKVQSQHWIRSALEAHFIYHAGHHYKIKMNEHQRQVIVPIDYANTGVVQNGTTWSDGLHQFLQIKHGLRVDAESITTNYLSNLALVSRYSNNVTGITGTLGSKESKKLLGEIYSIDFVDIPTYKTKQLKKLPDILTDSTAEWLEEITHEVVQESQHGRVVLVICESINKAETVRAQIIKKANGKRVYLYSEDDKNQDDFLNVEIEAGSIIVATNLAGRGTDLRILAEAIKQGGGHVCGTFLPENKRVEDQIFGRVARKGEPGSAHLILNKSEVFDGTLGDTATIEDMRKMRDFIEQEQLDKIRKIEFPRIKFKDFLFSYYLKLLEDLKEIDSNLDSYVAQLTQWDMKDAPKNSCDYLKNGSIQFKRAALEERWGFWLKELNVDQLLQGIDPEKLDDQALRIKAGEKFHEFKSLIFHDYQTNKIIQNPSYYISQGNHFLTLAKSITTIFDRSSLYSLALKSFEEAIALDDNAYLAHYGRAYALLKIKGDGYKIAAKKCLKKCEKIISTHVFSQEEASATLVNRLEMIDSETHATDLTGQLSQHVELLSVLLRSIKLAIKEIEKSERLMDVSIVDGAMTVQVETLDEAQAVEVCDNSKGLYSVRFHDLSVASDSGDSLRDKACQSLSTFEELKKFIIRKKSKRSKVNVVFCGDQLTLTEGDIKHSLKKLLPINLKVDIKPKDEGVKDTGSLKQLVAPTVALTGVDKVSAIGSKLVDGAAYFYKGVKAGAAFVASPARQLVNGLGELWFARETARKLPVSVSLESLALENAIEVFAKPVMQGNVNLVIKHADKDIVDMIMERFFVYQPVVSTHDQVKVVLSKDDDVDRTIQKSVSSIDEKSVADITLKGCQRDQALVILQAISSLREKRKETDKKLASKDCLLVVDIEFSNVTQEQAEKIIDESTGRLKLSFNGLTEDNLAPLVHSTKAQHENALFEFCDLDVESAKYLIKHADRPNRDFNIHTQPVETEFLKMGLSRDQRAELKSYGYFQLYSLKEKKPMPWKSLCLVAGLGLLQIAGGIALMTMTVGFGVNMGIGLIAEGLSDIVRACTIVYSGEFDFSKHLMQKSMRMGLSLAFAGWGAVRAAATAAKGAATLLDQALVGTSAAFKEALTKFGLTLAEKVSTEAVSRSCSALGTAVVHGMKNSINKYANNEVRRLCFSGDWKATLNKAFAIDQFRGDSHFYNDLLTAANKIVQGMPFALPQVGIVDLSGLDQFSREFRDKLNATEQELKFEKHFLRWVQKLHHDVSLDETDIPNICRMLEEKGILSPEGHVMLQGKALQACYQSSFSQETALQREVNCYDFKNYHLQALSLEQYDAHKPYIIQACLEYHRIMSDNHCTKIITFSSNVATAFSDVFHHSTQTAINVMANAVAQGANVGVSHAFHEHALKKLATQTRVDVKSDAAVSDNTDAVSSTASDESMQSTSSDSTVIVRGAPTKVSLSGPKKLVLVVKKSDDSAEPMKVIVSPPSREVRHGHLFGRSHSAGHSVHERVMGGHSADHHKVLLVHKHSVNEQHVGTHPSIAHRGLGSHKVHHHFVRRSHPSDSCSKDILHRLSARDQRSLREAAIFNKVKAKQIKQELPAVFQQKHGANQQLLSQQQGGLKVPMKVGSASLLISVSMVQNTLIEAYKAHLNAKNNLTWLEFQSVCNIVHDEKLKLCDVILREKSKVLKTLIGILISEVRRRNLDKQQEDQLWLEENIKELSINIFEKSIKCPDKAYQIVLDYIGATNEDFGEMGNELKKMFSEYFKFKQERTMWQQTGEKALKELDFGKLADKLFDSADKGNYSECGNLLREGKLGEGAFIAGSLIQGMFKSSQMASEHRMRMQCMLVKYQEKVLQYQERALKMVFELEKERREFVDRVVARIEVHLIKANTLLEKAFAGRDRSDILAEKAMNMQPGEAQNTALRLAEARRGSADQDVAAATKAIDATQSTITAVADICKANGMDPRVVIECVAEITKQVSMLSESMKEIGRQETSSLKAIIDASKEIIIAVITKKQPAIAPVDEAEVPVTPAAQAALPAAAAPALLPTIAPAAAQSDWKAIRTSARTAYNQGVGFFADATESKTKEDAREARAAFARARDEYRDLLEMDGVDAAALREAEERVGETTSNQNPRGRYSPRTVMGLAP